MRKILLCILLLLVGVISFHIGQKNKLQLDVVRDTICRTDTLMVRVPQVYCETIIDSVPYPVFMPLPGDTIKDTVFVYVPISQKVYRDSLYTVWVSGYRANLDSIEVYQKVQTIYIRDNLKRNRFGVGLQVGYGYPCGMYAGIGVSYNLFSW